MTGSAVALIKGATLHPATHFEGSKRKITDVDSQEWKSTRIFFLFSRTT